MVRNLVLTPFIDPAYAHFIFSCEKYSKFFSLDNSKKNKRDLRFFLSSIIFS